MLKRQLVNRRLSASERLISVPEARDECRTAPSTSKAMRAQLATQWLRTLSPLDFKAARSLLGKNAALEDD